MSACEVCIELGETCHDCKAARKRVAPKPVSAGIIDRHANKAVKTLTSIRRRELKRFIERDKTERELRDNGVVKASITREAAGRSQRVALGHHSRFYDPAHAVAKAIGDALDPNATPTRRWVPKKQEKRELNFLFRADGKLNTQRYNGWPVEEVAEVNPNFLVFLTGLPAATPEDKSKIRKALIRQAMKSTKARRETATE